MARSDRLILERLETGTAIKVESLLQDIPFPEEYVRWRLRWLAQYGLVHYSDGDELVNLTSEGQGYKDRNTLPLGIFLPQVDGEYPPVPWLDWDEIVLLEDIDSDGGYFLFDDIGRTKMERASQLQKLSELGLLHRKNRGEFLISELGKSLLQGKTSQAHIISGVVPYRIRWVNRLGMFILNSFDKTDQSENELHVDTKKVKLQVVPIFLNQFYKRMKIYVSIATVILLVSFLLWFHPFINTTFQTFGLLLDIAGAILIAMGLFRGVTGFAADVPRSAGSYGGKYVKPLRAAQLSSAATKTIDGAFGTLLLTLGFSLQVVSTITFS